MRHAVALGVIGFAVGAVGFGEAASVAGAASCRKPAGLKVIKTGPAKVSLRWRAPRRGPFRVLRGTRVVGQTKHRSMTVNVLPGRRVRLGVGVVRAHGRAPRCYARVAALIKVARHASGAPAAPTQLRIESVADGAATIAWDAVSTARRYRVSRDGATAGETAGRTYTIRVAPGRSASVSVAAVSADGRIGAPSAPLTVRTDRSVPGAPRALRAEAVTPFGLVLSWDRGDAGSAPVRGFRVSRNGIVVGQVAQPSIRLGGLLPSTRYTLSVMAVDTQGLPSAPATLEVTTPAPDAASGSTQAFVLASTSSSFADFRDHYQRVGTVYPTYYDCDRANPSHVSGKDDPQVTEYARARGVTVMPRYNCQSVPALRAIMGDPATRAAVISGLVDLVRTYGYDGINLDFESGTPSDRQALSDFTAALADALHGIGARLGVDVSPKTYDVLNHPRSSFYDYAALARAADTVLVMAWGWHWRISAPGPLVDLPVLSRVAAYVRSVPGAERFTLATAGYGFDWPAGGGPDHPATPLGFGDLQKLIASTGARPARDPATQELHFSYTDGSGTGHEVWFRDATSIAAARDVARGQGLGFGLWRLGQEDQAVWDVL